MTNQEARPDSSPSLSIEQRLQRLSDQNELLTTRLSIIETLTQTLKDDIKTVRTERNYALLVSLILFFMFAIVATNKVFGQAARKPKKIDIRQLERVPNPSDAIGYMAADLAKIDSIEDRLLQLYLFVPPYMMESAWWAGSFAVNSAASRSSRIRLPRFVSGGSLLNWNALALGITKEEALRIRNVWIAIAKLDQRLYTPIDVFAPVAPVDLEIVIDGEPVEVVSLVEVISDRTPVQYEGKKIGNLNAGDRVPIVKQKEDFYFMDYVSSDGSETAVKGWIYSEHVRVIETVANVPQAELPKLSLEKPGLIATNKLALGPHLDNRKIAGLASLYGVEDPTTLEIPLVSLDAFITFGLSQRQQQQGKYYDLMGFNDLDRDGIFERFGINPIISAKLQSDQRAAIYKSQVAGGTPRQIEQLKGAAGRSWETLDMTSDDVDVNQHAIYSLLTFKVAARENIFRLPNQLLGFFLADGNGKLVDEAPQNVANNRRIPPPHNLHLEAMISCVGCHGEFDGFMPFTNDVPEILRGRLDIYDDLGNLKESVDERLIRISELFTGDFEIDLLRERQDYNAAIWQCMNRAGTADKEGNEAARIVSAMTMEIYNRFKFSDVSPERALLELGYRIPEESGIHPSDALFTLIPDDQSVSGFGHEDLTIGLLKDDSRIHPNRIDWGRAYGTAAFRAFQTAKAFELEAKTVIKKEGVKDEAEE